MKQAKRRSYTYTHYGNEGVVLIVIIRMHFYMYDCTLITTRLFGWATVISNADSSVLGTQFKWWIKNKLYWWKSIYNRDYIFSIDRNCFCGRKRARGWWEKCNYIGSFIIKLRIFVLFLCSMSSSSSSLRCWWWINELI